MPSGGGSMSTLIDIRQIAELMGRHPNQVWNHHRYARELENGTRRSFKNPMPMPKVYQPEKLWDEDEIQYWLETRTPQTRRPPQDMRPCHSRRYPAAARKIAKHLGLPCDQGVKREFDARPNYAKGTVIVSITTRHELTVEEYNDLIIGSQR